MTSGERIKILRILNGYTQQTLAEITGVSRASVMAWEKGNLPTRRTATILGTTFDVNLEFLLDGRNPPLTAVWKPIFPGHPKHIQSMAIDLKLGIHSLFEELEINYAAKGQNENGEIFMLCGKTQKSKEFKIGGKIYKDTEWQLNFLLLYDKSLDELLTDAVKASGSSITDIGNIDGKGRFDIFLTDCRDAIFKLTEEWPKLDHLYNRLEELDGIGYENYTLEGLLKKFGKFISANEFHDNDIDSMASYIAKVIEKRTGLKSIKNNSSNLIKETISSTLKNRGNLKLNF